MPADTAPLAPRAPLPFSTIFGDRMEMLTQFGDHAGERGIARFSFGTRRVVLVNEANAVGEVLLIRAGDFHKGPALSIYARPLLGDGLLTSEENVHKRQRKLAAPAFAHKRIVGYADVMTHAAERAVTRWQNGATVDIAREMMSLTLGVVGKTLFNADDVENEADELGRALTVVLHHFDRVVRAPFRLPFAWIPPWQVEVKRALARLDETIYGLIRERRTSGTDAGDLLSMLMLARDAETGEAMSDQQLRDEAMTIFLAGHETTANALAWSWHLLTRHLEIYARLQTEVDTVLAGRTPTYDDLEKLPYTRRVFDEVLRLYPPAFAIPRQATRATVIGGFHVPARAIVLVSPYLLHRRPDYFPHPDVFDPDRWEGEPTHPRYAYLPFGGGPRICIGSAFALMEGHLTLAAIAQRVTFRAANTNIVPPEATITLRPRGGVPVIVEKRGT